MSVECRELVAGLLVVLAWVVWLVLRPRYVAWRTRRQLALVFRQQLRVFDGRHVDVWARQQGGRDSPPR